ncbi:hypothetical protein GCG54_00003077 [Colletotrichum gloeosporioides]|uniref:Uncharacterized protein n=1 Tax=Colletotrichum gloeosporioides TaxID=474922 RepID=A0A8H4CVU7_COLGL|nr:uncharacterized protein GCG54_00003077 [Colletotrichum gloeosporioides]KAF3810899.1 hypothetical protein GCG54_00003077 [Colletotrichum gloeosporioides]
MRPVLILSLFLGAVMAIDPELNQAQATPSVIRDSYTNERARGKRASRKNQAKSQVNVLIPLVSLAVVVIAPLVGSPAPSSF